MNGKEIYESLPPRLRKHITEHHLEYGLVAALEQWAAHAQAAIDDAYEEGRSDGYEEGRDCGREDGWEDGYDEGKHEGHDEGYEAGLAEGYEAGIAEGSLR